MSRVLAVVVAIGMVAGALYVRDRIDDDGGGGGAGGGDVRVVCAPEVAEACFEVADDITLEDAAATAEGLLEAERFEFDGWVTPGPWPAIVDALRSSAGRPPLFGDGGEAVASSRLALVAQPDAPQGWRAIADALTAGDLRLGWNDPATGIGLLQVGAFAVGYFEGPDFVTNDFDAAFTGYLEGIEDEAVVARDPLERRLQQGRSFADAVMSFQAEADPTLEAAAASRRGDLAPTYPDPVVAVDAVATGEPAGDIGRELQELGWDEPGASGLPAPGVLAALWREVSR